MPQRVVHVVAGSKKQAQRLMEDPNFRNELLSWHRQMFGI
jgi:hypothetical protein